MGGAAAPPITAKWQEGVRHRISGAWLVSGVVARRLALEHEKTPQGRRFFMIVIVANVTRRL